MALEIKEVTQEEMLAIIDTREPIGLFYRQDEDTFIAVDNTTGDAWTEEFDTLQQCRNWLAGEATIDKDKLYKKAIASYGDESQIMMMLEEMSELQKELCKSLRGYKVTGKIAEEIADVEIMLEQMKMIFGIEKSVPTYKQFKLERLHQNLLENDFFEE